jgi:hypothetical protein
MVMETESFWEWSMQLERAERAQPEELAVRAEEIARRLLWKQPHSQIQRELGITARQFTHITKNYGPFKTIMERLCQETWNELDEQYREELGDVQTIAKRHSVEAIDTLVELMGCPDPNIKRQSAKDVIEYSGVIKPKGGGGVTINLQDSQLALLLATAREDDERNGDGQIGPEHGGGPPRITGTCAK